VLWLIVLVALIAIFGIGTLLEAAFWGLVIAAVVVVAGALVIGRLIGGGSTSRA